MREVMSVHTTPITSNINQMDKSLSRDFKSGQLVIGKIIKLFPNQKAEVQIGSQKMIAALDVPLRAGEQYWLQVQPGDEQIKLKVLNPTVNGGTKVTAEQILSHLSMPITHEAVSLAKYLIKNELPILKNTLQVAAEWLKTSGDQNQALQVVKAMMVNNLPFVDEVFKALQSQGSSESLYGLLTRLRQELKLTPPTNVTNQLTTLLNEIGEPLQEKLSADGLQKAAALWSNPEASAELRAGAFSLLQLSGFLSEEENTNTVLEKLQVNMSKGEAGESPILKDGQKLLTAYIQSLQSGHRPNAEKLLQAIHTLSGISQGTEPVLLQRPAVLAGNLLHAALSASQQSETILNLLTTNNMVDDAKAKLAALLNNKEPQVTRNLPENVNRAVQHILENDFKYVDLSKGAAAAPFLKEIIRLLGLNMEHALSSQENLAETELTGLKPLLMQLKNESHGAVINELADQVLNRVTAQQLMSHDTGPIQQLFMQIPLPDHQSDLTVEWSGRRTKDGHIDPNYCRILFYLDLAQLKETVVDMQIQNRIVKVSVFNQYATILEQAAHPFVTLLRDKLEQQEYKLSGVVFEEENQRESAAVIPAIRTEVYSRMDIKI